VQIKGKNEDAGDKFSPERAAFYAVLSLQRQAALRIAPLRVCLSGPFITCLSTSHLLIYDTICNYLKRDQNLTRNQQTLPIRTTSKLGKITR